MWWAVGVVALASGALAIWGWRLHRHKGGPILLVIYPLLVGVFSPFLAGVVVVASLVSAFKEVGRAAVEEKADTLSQGIATSMNAGLAIFAVLLAVSWLLNVRYQLRRAAPPAEASPADNGMDTPAVK
ncbi:MAG: hypothetical protein AAF938_27875 [Myxococcota bacterium]